MTEDEEAVLKAQGFVLEAMVMQLVWKWALDKPHPPTALAEFLRPLEEGFAAMVAQQSPPTRELLTAQATMREYAEELERTLQREALRRAGAPDKAN